MGTRHVAQSRWRWLRIPERGGNVWLHVKESRNLVFRPACAFFKSSDGGVYGRWHNRLFGARLGNDVYWCLANATRAANTSGDYQPLRFESLVDAARLKAQLLGAEV